MKKIAPILLVIICHYGAKAQSLTVNNTTSCSISFSVLASDPGTCDIAYTSQSNTVTAGGSVIYPNVAALSWVAPGTPPTGSGLSGITILDDGQLKYTGDDCASLPPSVGYTSDCSTPQTASFSVGSGGNATVTFY